MENKDAAQGSLSDLSELAGLSGPGGLSELSEFQETEPKERFIVNPLALVHCTVKQGDKTARVMDISLSRLVIEEIEPWPSLTENEPAILDFILERQRFSATLILKSRRKRWLRFDFEKTVPSVQAHLRSFLSPKKIGESIIEDWRTSEVRHFHGLGECSMWFDLNGGVFFTLLDSREQTQQFMVRMNNTNAPLQTGKILSVDYLEMKSLDAELPLIPLTDKESYTKLSECRDIITNFRPTGQIEYALKQRLLKVISEKLYSTSNRVEYSPFRPVRTMTTQMDG